MEPNSKELTKQSKDEVEEIEEEYEANFEDISDEEDGGQFATSISKKHL